MPIFDGEYPENRPKKTITFLWRQMPKWTRRTERLIVPVSAAGVNAGCELSKEIKMAWKTPKIVEVSVGMEINMYACASRK